MGWRGISQIHIMAIHSSWLSEMGSRRMRREGWVDFDALLDTNEGSIGYRTKLYALGL